jgi:hypothetical protein
MTQGPSSNHKNHKRIAIASAALLFCIIYFGFSLTDKNKKSKLDKERALTTEVTGPETLLKEAKTSVSADTLDLIGRVEHLTEGEDTTAITENLKRLSGLWYSQKKYGLAGYYAQQVASIEETAMAWSIAGTTFGVGVKTLPEGTEKEFCTGRAVKAFEHAISLQPEETAHRINLASIYTDVPPKDNPMKGIQMLLEMNKNEPENIAVMNLLGQLAIKTGQYDKAITRLEKSYQTDPKNSQTPCLLSAAYEGAGQHDKAHEIAKLCNQ